MLESCVMGFSYEAQSFICGELYNFCINFTTIILEALPFIIAGSFISAIMQVYLSEERLSYLIPKNKFLGLLMASLLGFIFPLCECAIVPISRRLIKKGMPLAMAITFMLAVPMVNPIVLVSTYHAFSHKPYMVMIRGGSGIIISILIGYFTGEVYSGKSILKSDYTDNRTLCNCGCEGEGSLWQTSSFTSIMQHLSSELYEIGKYLVVGAALSAACQSVLIRDIIAPLGAHPIFSVLALMSFAFCISICSEADAFVAREFLGQFTYGSLAAFLVLGPMIDIKNVLMLSGIYKKGFVFWIVTMVISACAILGWGINIFLR